jgi:acyl carrier protein
MRRAIAVDDLMPKTDSEIYAVLTDIFREVFQDDRIALTAKMTNRHIKGWDSANMVSIIMAVEERFGFEMRSSEIDNLKSVGDFVAVIKAHTRA